MPVFEHFPKRNIANDRDDDADYEDCYEDEIPETYDRPFQHPSENLPGMRFNTLKKLNNIFKKKHLEIHQKLPF